MQVVPRPARVARGDPLGLDRTVPGSSSLLVRPDVVEMAQPDQRHADEPAVLAEHHVEETLEHVGLAEHVVVEEQRVGRRGLVEQELALLGEAAPGQVPVRLDLTPARLAAGAGA